MQFLNFSNSQAARQSKQTSHEFLNIKARFASISEIIRTIKKHQKARPLYKKKNFRNKLHSVEKVIYSFVIPEKNFFNTFGLLQILDMWNSLYNSFNPFYRPLRQNANIIVVFHSKKLRLKSDLL